MTKPRKIHSRVAIPKPTNVDMLTTYVVQQTDFEQAELLHILPSPILNKTICKKLHNNSSNIVNFSSPNSYIQN